MHASAGISVRPWLAPTRGRILVTSSSSVGRCCCCGFSKWAKSSLSSLNSIRGVEYGKHSDFVLEGKRKAGPRSLRCYLGDNGGLDGFELSKGARLQRGWRWRQVHTTSGSLAGLGLWDSSAKGGRRSVATNARRGFLSELQSLKDEKEAGTSGSVEFESPLQIILYPDPRLRNKNKRITVFDEKLNQLVKEMFDVMYKTDGVGLAAPQVGVNLQLMLYNPEGERGKGAEYILVNPKIVKYGKQRDVFREGCLSFLQLEADVERPLTVRVEAQDIKGKKFGISLKGWQARIFQHEYDHLEGVLYHDRMTPAQMDPIRTGLGQLEEEYARRTGLPAPERVTQ